MAWQTSKRCSLVVIGGACLGLALNAVVPWGIPYLPAPPQVALPGEMISLEQAHQLWQAGAIFLDARAAADYELGHIGNALSLPAQDFGKAFGRVGPMLPPNVPIIVYCDGVDCDLSHQLKDRLAKEGFADVRVLANGWTLWRQAGWPISKGSQP